MAVRNIPDGARLLAAQGLDEPFGPGREPAEADEEDDYDDEAAAWGDEGDWNDEEVDEDEDDSFDEEPQENDRRARP